MTNNIWGNDHQMAIYDHPTPTFPELSILKDRFHQPVPSENDWNSHENLPRIGWNLNERQEQQQWRRSVQQFMGYLCVTTTNPFIHRTDPSVFRLPDDSNYHCIPHVCNPQNYGFMVIPPKINCVFLATIENKRPIMPPWPCIMTQCEQENLKKFFFRGEVLETIQITNDRKPYLNMN